MQFIGHTAQCYSSPWNTENENEDRKKKKKKGRKVHAEMQQWNRKQREKNELLNTSRSSFLIKFLYINKILPQCKFYFLASYLPITTENMTLYWLSNGYLTYWYLFGSATHKCSFSTKWDLRKHMRSSKHCLKSFSTDISVSVVEKRFCFSWIWICPMLNQRYSWRDLVANLSLLCTFGFFVLLCFSFWLVGFKKKLKAEVKAERSFQFPDRCNRTERKRTQTC